MPSFVRRPPHRRRADRSRAAVRRAIPADGRRLDRRPAGTGRLSGSASVRCAARSPCSRPTTRGRGPSCSRATRYLVTRPDGRVLVGSTEERRRLRRPPTAAAIAGLLAFAADLVPSWRAQPWNAAGRACVPAAPTACPSSAPVPDCANLFVAAGHFRAGIQLSPGTGRVHDGPAPRPHAGRAAGGVPPRPAARPAGADGIPILNHFG